ncbi:hypothetical protein PHJA_001743700 [Phtheirospermum japonicum]|uniref:Eukaryotic translation initiation factor-related n=1 Tax=Phtheirospermum japonicum TaxID=374723 RepID=A0A830C9Z9_9LAMI|nr:hypothetical protein PHJA_001743700 [Phtheirospermum japonicum]
MSKKKATMTLKDFHGGSIPSDLRLPSAPGVTVRPVDRPGFDRQMSWGNPVGRPDHRTRPASAGSARNLDEKTPFFSHSSHIGRNFDEDERKPLDGVSGPRRTIGDESVRAQSSRVAEPKVDNSSGPRVGSRASASSIPLSQTGSSPSSYASRVSEAHNNARLNHQTSGGNNRGYGSGYPVMGGNNAAQAVGGNNAAQAVGGSYPNAWGLRKETVCIKETVEWSGPNAETKLAHASALEKVSSGRWNSKQLVGSPKKDAVGESEYHDVTLAMHAERGLARSYERSASFTGKSGGPEPLESSERPKLKLLPRSKPVENVESSPTDYKQISNHLHVEDSYVVHEPKNPLQSGSVGPVVGDRAPERPKLNLKPRTQTPEHLEGNGGSKRGTVFGGARPRELVLKERGIEDDVSSYESPPPLRVKEHSPKADTFMTHIPPARYNEKAEANATDQRIAAKYTDRRDNGEKADPHRRNNRPNEIRRNNNRDVVENKNRNQQQKQQDNRAPSPETWRKPVEPDSSSHDAPAVRYGKAASAVELAQAFSKSVSDPTMADRFPGSRGVPSRGQMPFSRLTGPTPRPQINGY